MRYTLIIPVYNRPDEIGELLESLCKQTCKDFEVIVVEDGSTVRCEEVAARYASELTLHYFEKPNSGPGDSRNFGAAHAQGEYYVVLDSDCVLPPGYIQALNNELDKQPFDAFGGPDRAHESFSSLQKAINYSMTSFFTTGGIRGGKKKMDKFYPRSFNMGLKASLWQQLGGFNKMRFGEDIDLSLRIFEAGASCRLFPEAWVWHKRRTDLKKFFRQVHNSGMARIHLEQLHPGSMKLVHILPALFTLGCFICVVAALVMTVFNFYGMGICAAWYLSPLVLYAFLIFVDATMRNNSEVIGFLAIAAAYVQLLGYGIGFLRAAYNHYVLGKEQKFAFEKTFYK